MVDFVLASPSEICAILGERCRQRRLLQNLSLAELAARVGVSDKTLGTFERSGKSSLDTFVRLLEALNALPDLQNLLQTQPTSIADMRQQAATRSRQRAYPARRAAKPKPNA